MSQLVQYIPAKKNTSYLFRIALDRIPEPDEKQEIKNSIQGAMESLGVPRELVAVNIFKSDVPPEIDIPQNEIAINRRDNWNYLLCILIRSEPGVLQQDPNEVMEEEISGFLQFSGLAADKVAAAVLENAYLEVQTRIINPGSGIYF